uniref:Uncharacterized protein n=1 Tax=Anguilla anguilla TaxID=7936 RepID=A0A0E9Q701_ANGAN
MEPSPASRSLDSLWNITFCRMHAHSQPGHALLQQRTLILCKGYISVV